MHVQQREAEVRAWRALCSSGEPQPSSRCRFAALGSPTTHMVLGEMTTPVCARVVLCKDPARILLTGGKRKNHQRLHATVESGP